MGLLKLSMATLTEFDGGRLRVSFDRLLRRVVEDCRDRASLDAVRKVSLELLVSPVCDDVTGEAEQLRLEYRLKVTMPAMARDGISLGVQKNGDLVFNENSLDNVDQRTLLDGDDEK